MELRNYLLNARLLTIIVVIIVITSIIISFYTDKWHWFGRSGAWVTMIGVVLSVRPFIRIGVNGWIQSQKVNNLGSIIATPEEIKEDTQKTHDANALKIGVYMSVVGTLIWAYGDLLGGLP